MKKTFTKLATAVFCLLFCMQTQAQTFGIAQTPNGTGATYSTKEINVETSPNATYTGRNATIDISTFPMGDYVYVAYQNGKSKSGIILKK